MCEYSADGSLVDEHVFYLCPIAAINKFFGTSFDLSGKGLVGQMNMAELSEVLDKQVVEKINKKADDNTAMIMAAIKDSGASLSQRLDISAQSQAQSQFDDAEQVAAEIERLQKIAARFAQEKAEKEAAALEAVEKKKKREAKLAEKAAKAARQAQQLQDATVAAHQQQMQMM